VVLLKCQEESLELATLLPHAGSQFDPSVRLTRLERAYIAEGWKKLFAETRRSNMRQIQGVFLSQKTRAMEGRAAGTSCTPRGTEAGMLFRIFRREGREKVIASYGGLQISAFYLVTARKSGAQYRESMVSPRARIRLALGANHPMHNRVPATD
jgi:hypothetical protein